MLNSWNFPENWFRGNREKKEESWKSETNFIKQIRPSLELEQTKLEAQAVQGVARLGRGLREERLEVRQRLLQLRDHLHGVVGLRVLLLAEPVELLVEDLAAKSGGRVLF